MIEERNWALPTVSPPGIDHQPHAQNHKARPLPGLWTYFNLAEACVFPYTGRMFLAPKTIARARNIVLNTRVVPGRKQLGELLAQLAARQSRTTIISWLNANAFTLAHKDNELADSLLRSSLLLRDGVGVSVLLRLLGRDPGVNMNGTDLIPRILRAYAGRPVALFGTCEPYLSRAAEAAERMGARVILRMDGFQDLEAYARALETHDVELVVLGMGVPKQERTASFIADRVAKPLLVLNGGAILDFMAERFPRAPKAWRRLRMEWLFRLIQEPQRLWRRYLLGGVVFLSHAAQLACVMRCGAPPVPDERG